MRYSRPIIVNALALLIGVTAMAHAEDVAAVRGLFEHPTRDYSSAPLWVWNDEMTEALVVGTLRDLAGQHVRQAFVHPRPGLVTPYLSDEWFELWKLALREAEKLDMNLWIYDENSYPSGFAGGHVPEEMPESRGINIVFATQSDPPTFNGDAVPVFRIDGDKYVKVTDDIVAGRDLPAGTYLLAAPKPAPVQAWNADRFYVDLIRPGVTEKFLEVTLDPYKREVGEAFGRRVPGVFTDEPEIQSAGGWPWTSDLAEQFKQRWGYDIESHLPCLHQRIGDWKRVRYHYFATLNDLFVERWGKPYHDYCEANNLEFTGHYWEHDWPVCLRVPDNMAMYAWHQRPAIDTLMNQYNESMHAQFGNVRAVKELASVANQLGRPRTLCEAYGAGGWDLRFEDMKRIGDWLYALGVNTLDEHLSYVTIRGARKRDHPQSFSYHEPWWTDYHHVADYFTRLSAAMSAGEEVNKVLVIEPTTTAWMYQTLGGSDPDLLTLGASFQKFITDLAKRQAEFDIGSEDLIARHGAVKTRQFVVGERSYDVVVIPEHTENLNATTVDLLEGYLKRGGLVLCCGEPPALIDGEPSDRISRCARQDGWKKVTVEDALERLPGVLVSDVRVRPRPDNRGILYHQRRILDDGELLFVVNTSLEHPGRASVRTDAFGATRWLPETGGYAQVDTTPGREGTIGFEIDLPPAGSALYFLWRDQRPVAQPAVPDRPAVIEPDGDMEIERVDPNVLTIDYVDVSVGGERRENLYVLKAAQFVYEQNGLAKNPWDRATQYKDEIIRRTFPEDSGFEATYRFTIADSVPPQLAIVIEQSDRYTITCNGREVAAQPGQWWLDKCFGRIDIGDAARVGENEVTITARPFDIRHELEAAYVIGDFGLKSAEKGFIIVPDAPLQAGPWNVQACPLYGHGVAYTQTFDIDEPDGRFAVTLPSWYGSVARVSVNGRAVGTIWHQPWTCTFSEGLESGENRITVTVIGTLKNTLGPHHGDPPLGLAWPHGFEKAPEVGPPPGDAYHTIGYGLFEGFELKRLN